ncbi:hypothetical protein K5M36_03345 [Chromobacterium vaccinii]|nr:hypothetical protein [Chromobacterium vaccinii]
MTEKKKIDSDADRFLLTTWHALHDGKLKVAPHLRELANELMSAPLTMVGLVDTSHLSENALSFGRTSGKALVVMAQHEPEPSPPLPCSIAETQPELFRLFAQLFAALTGQEVARIVSEQEIQDRIFWRFQHEIDEMAAATNVALDELEEFYNTNAVKFFQYAKTLGGMRLVSGGQRTFGPSALNAIRITGLYADTQLLPDPVYPFLASNLHLNARHIQLALALFFVLQLRPLVDARLPVPPVFVFPSFEEKLEERDAHTKHGVEQLMVRMVQPVCDGTITSLSELFEYANRHGESFAQALLANGLFIPPGAHPDQRFGVTEAVKAYIAALEGVRSEEMLTKMKTLPTGALLLNGVLERIRPHYHLLENAAELGAQPLLSQRVHWHYFERCAQANAEDLRRNNVLSEQSFQTLRAVQDESLSWLATIPIQTLTELISNNEHRWLREELNKYTMQLASGGAIDTNDMVREVSFGLASLVQRQQRIMSDIERKYAPKKMATYFGGGSTLAVAATATFLPSLSPLLGAAIPIAAAVGGGLVGFGKEKIGELVEKRQAKRSMLGVLATVRPH